MKATYTLKHTRPKWGHRERWVLDIVFQDEMPKELFFELAAIVAKLRKYGVVDGAAPQQ